MKTDPDPNCCKCTPCFCTIWSSFGCGCPSTIVCYVMLKVLSVAGVERCRNMTKQLSVKGTDCSQFTILYSTGGVLPTIFTNLKCSAHW